MACRALYVFSHASALGEEQAHKLFDRVHCSLHGDSSTVARAFRDYTLSVDDAALPAGLTLTRIVE